MNSEQGCSEIYCRFISCNNISQEIYCTLLRNKNTYFESRQYKYSLKYIQLFVSQLFINLDSHNLGEKSFADQKLAEKMAKMESYGDLSWIPPTSNKVERLFSRAKLVVLPKGLKQRKSILKKITFRWQNIFRFLSIICEK